MSIFFSVLKEPIPILPILCKLKACELLVEKGSYLLVRMQQQKYGNPSVKSSK